MKNSVLTYFSNAALIVFGSVSIPALASYDATNWAELARQDILEAYNQTAANHPGMVDINNPSFPELLIEAKNSALSLAEQAKSAQGLMAAVGRFNTVLQDGHAGAFTRIPEELQVPVKWPGFTAVWRGEDLVINYTERELAEVGSRLIRCDGVEIKTLLRDQVFQFRGQVEQPGHWWRYGHELLIDRGNPFVQSPSTCQFVNNQGATHSLKLTWSEMPEQATQAITFALNGDRIPVGLAWRGSLAWIAMPTFGPEAEDVARYEQLFKDLQEQQDKLAGATAVILDLRHNQGGSSYWSRKVAEGLWGEAPVNQLRQEKFSSTEVWWRASAGNTAYMADLINILSSRGQQELVSWIQGVQSGMQHAIDAGDDFYVEANAEMTNENGMTTPSTFTTPVYVIVPGQCASACLDAIDIFKLFDNTKLVGAPSSSDSTYMEVRLADLPSGYGKIVIPNKVYVNRPRGNGEYYSPDYPYDGLEWTTEAFNNFIQDIIKGQ
ncbi:peptidase [Pseudidiomarina marina]|uniref:S41 family peptidase n=1 Tax=Pseudidiomarina marina TaxID=502366 RepID=UPI00384B3CC2